MDENCWEPKLNCKGTVQRLPTELLNQVPHLLCSVQSGIVMGQNNIIAKNTRTLPMPTKSGYLVGLLSEPSQHALTATVVLLLHICLKQHNCEH